MSKTLHILNGDSLSIKFKKFSIEGDVAIWREMLCEGKTVFNLASEDFKRKRILFFKENYPDNDIDYETHFGSQLAIIADAYLYDNIILWFEYDLFCHINMLACISFIKSIGYKGTIYLVCSGRIKGEKQLQGLSQLSDKELQNHYKNKIQLDNHDLFLANDFWRLYCGNDHSLLNPKRATDSKFKYLSNCISAHKERFPNETTGLNTLETHLLRLIREHEIRSTNQLCGYMINYQGYYGYGDLQILQIIKRMNPFYELQDDVLVLTKQGVDILDNQHNEFKRMQDDTYLGGVLKYEYTYNTGSSQLTKH